MNSDVAAAARRGLRWLERNQHRDGHWQGDNPLSELHATTRCTRAFVGLGFPADYPVVARATRWLVQPKGEEIYHYFWRLGALVEIPGVAAEIIDHDFDVVRQTIRSKLKLDTKLSYHAFLFDCAATYGIGTRFEAEALELEQSLDAGELTITPALWGFVGLERSGRPMVEKRTSTLIRNLQAAIHEQSGSANLNGLVTETSFFVFNVCRSSTLSADPGVRTAIRGAVRWLASRQEQSGSWPVERPLYNNDPQCPAYFTGIATRALVEYLRRYEPQQITQVFLKDWHMRSIARTAVLWGSALCVSVAATVCAFRFLPNRWNTVITGLGVAASLIEVGAFLMRIRRHLKKG